MPVLSAAEIAAITSGRLHGSGDVTVHSLVADSRVIPTGAGFIAIRDGHRYVEEALGSGARLALVEDETALPRGATGIVVGDVITAVQELAGEVRSHLQATVVGITGSTGKTLTKDFAQAAMRSERRVHASPASYNNEIGVPLVLLSCPDDAEVLVVELGARRPGNIADLCRIVRPRIGIVTGIGITHVGIFGSREAIARTKSELLQSLPPDGIAFVPSDDDFLDLLSASTSARLETVGPAGHTRMGPVSLSDAGTTHARVVLGGREVEVMLPLPGPALVRNAAFALRLAAELEVELVPAARSLSHASTSSWRMEVRALGGRTVVNDAYNASPTSTAAALRTVRRMARGGEAWAVLGEMAELGPFGVDEHVRIGRLAAALGFAGLVVVGAGAADLATGYGPAARRAEGAEEAARIIEEDSAPGAFVLIKASRVAGLERVADLLASEAALAKEREA